METPTIYHNTISELEYVFDMMATPLPTFDNVYLLCHHQFPNSKSKKIAIGVIDKIDTCFDVYNYDKELEYTNIPGQYPTSIGPALIKNIEMIFHDVLEMVKMSKILHNL